MKGKKKLKYLLSILLSLVLMLGLMPGLSLTAYAATLDNESTIWSGNSVIAGDVTINNNVTVNADITLTIPEGKTLTINGQSDYVSDAAIHVGYNLTLTVSGGGTLIVIAPAEEEGHPPFDGIFGNLIVDGATVQVTGGADGVHGNVTVKSGSVCVNGGNGEAGGNGYDGISGNVIVNGGSITVIGGNGGNGDTGDGGSGGDGVIGDVIVNGGSATITGGNGGTKGSATYASNGYSGQAVYGSITGNAEESEDNTNWTSVTGSTSSEQYIKIEPILVTGLTLDKTTAQTIDVDDKVSFTATVAPGNASDKTVKWSVGGTNADAVTLYSDEACENAVTLDTATETLTVYAKGISAGSATVTCTSNANSTKSASCDVTVNAGNTVVEYPLWVGGVQVTSANKDDVLGDTDEGATVVFTPAVDDNAATTDVNESSPATLTLNGADISGGEYAAIYADGFDLTINVTENSTVTGPETNGLDNSTGIKIHEGCLTITGSGRLTTTGGESASFCSYGIDVDGAVTINGPLNASGGETQDAVSCGIYAGGVITVSSSGTLAASGGTGGAGSYGIWANVTVDGSLSAIGNSQAIYGTVKNSIAGTGWTDTEGTMGKASIAVSAAGQELNYYKKVQFPAVPDPVAYIDHNATTGTAETKACTSYTAFVEGTNSTLTTIPAGWYVIISGNAIATNRLVVSGTVNLILCDGATLIARKGITVTSGNTLNIYAGSIDETILGTGKLYAGTINGIISTCEGECAGIGGNVGTGGGKVTIHGGEVTALGNTKGAGIGGGNGGAGGTVTIYGGTVTTSGDGQGKGIGAGHNGTGNGKLTLGTGMHLYGGTSANPENDPGNLMAKVENDYARSQYMTVNNSSPHSHDFTYTENGAVITATCANSDQEHIGDTTSTLTIVKPALTTYGGTGSETATLSGLTAFNSATGLSVDAADIKYVGRDGTAYNESATAPTNAGKYTAKITITGVKTGEGDDKSVTACVDYEIAGIAPVAGDFTFTAPSDLNYDGTAKSATVTAASTAKGMGAVTVKYYSDAACGTEAEPVNAGTYYVGITVTEGDNYNATTAVLHGEDWKFKINRANATSSTITVNNRTYDGTEKPLVTEDKSTLVGGEMWYALGENATTAPADDLYTTSIPTATDAGTYYVWYRVVGDENHEDSDPAGVKTVTIDDYTPSSGGGGGTSGGSTYAPTPTITSTPTPQPKATVVTAPSGLDLVYNGSLQGLAMEGLARNGSMWYALGGSSNAPVLGWRSEIPSASDIGTYYIWFWVVGEDGYDDSDMNYVVSTIADPKATATPTAKPTASPTAKPAITGTPVDHYEEVKVSNGIVKDITGTEEARSETNPFEASIDNNEKLETLLEVNKDEKAAGVNVWLEVADVSDVIPEEEKKAFESSASEDYKVAMYVDITLFKKVGSAQEEKVHETNGKVKISILVPEELRENGREYQIIRYHEGVATVIEGTYDPKTFMFTFETDRFSSYAIAYKEGSLNVRPPKTGVGLAFDLWLALMIMALGGILYLGRCYKKEKV